MKFLDKFYLFYQMFSAENEAKPIDLQFKKDLEVYKQLKATQNLDNEALLAYLADKAISNAKNDIRLATKSPASTLYL